MIAWLLARPRLIAYGLAGAAMLGAATWAWVTVSGWRHDSERLPAVVAERDAARVERAATEASLLGHYNKALPAHQRRANRSQKGNG